MKLTITIEVDEDDARAIQAAMKERRSWGIMPDGESDENTAVVAEICRGWSQWIAKAKMQPPPLDQERISKILGSTMHKIK